MKRFSTIALFAAIACCAAAAQAGTLKSADIPPITNGGTGFIGVTQSFGMPAQPFNVRWNATATTPIPLQAGEASTFVQGQPNANPDAPGVNPAAAAGDHVTGNLRTMGNAGSMSDFPPGAHPQWGTPD